MAQVDLFVFLDDAQFEKNDWQHRNRIRNVDGWQWLSVPTTYRYPQKINQVHLDYSAPWPQKHLKALDMCYSRTPHYRKYRELLAAFYAEKPATIETLNITVVSLMSKLLGISVPFERTSNYRFEGRSTERLLEICRHFGATEYLAGAGGHAYMDVTLFEQAGIHVDFQDFSCPHYPQCWMKSNEEFIPNLSALDLLFNCGEESLRVLMGKA
jgi:hypothetical protein